MSIACLARLVVMSMLLRFSSSALFPPPFQVMNKVLIVHHVDLQAVTVEWQSSAESDMWADSVLAVILQIETRPETVKRMLIIKEEC